MIGSAPHRIPLTPSVTARYLRLIPLSFSGTTIATTLSLSGCASFTSPPPLTHTYTQAGTYSISVSASSTVNSQSYSFNYTVIEFPSSPQFSNLPNVLSYPFPITFLNFTFATGTNLVLQSNFNQTTGTVMYFESNHSGIIQFPANSVTSKGDFELSLMYDTTLTNPITITSIIEIDVPIPTAQIVGLPLALNPTADPNPANHYVNLKFILCYKTGAMLPRRQNMNFSYGDGRSLLFTNFTCNASAADTSLQCPSNYSFCFEIPPNSYIIMGNLTASANLFNLHNQINASFNFFIYSQIYNLTDSLYAMPFGITQSSPNTTNFWTPSNIPYYPLERPIWFLSELQFGTETPVSYWWSFGDGTYNITFEPFILHQYTSPGSYKIILNTSNPVSNERTNLIFNNAINRTSSITVQRLNNFINH